MVAEYERDLNRCYLVLPVKEDDYQIRMLKENESNGILKIRTSSLDGKERMMFDITGKQSIEKAFSRKKISYKEMTEIFYAIEKMVKECERLLIDSSEIVMLPEYIYWDIKEEKLFWVFNPFDKEACNIMDLASFLLERADNTDTESVRLSYEFYKRAKEGSINVDNLYEVLVMTDEEIYENAKKIEEAISSLDVEACLEKRKEAWLKKKAERMLNKIKNKKKDDSDLNGSMLKGQKVVAGNEHVSPKEFVAKKEALPKREFVANSEPAAYSNYSRKEDYVEESILKEDPFVRNAPGQTVLLNLPDENTRRLISRDGKIPDGDLSFFPCIIGSGRDYSDICIEEKSISHIHASIDEHDGQLYIFDLKSKNGTYVNGVRIQKEEKPIEKGDEISFGSVRFVLA